MKIEPPTKMNMTNPPSPRSRGVAMVMVMIALTVATIITLSFLSSQTTSTAIAHNATRQVQARAIAEDGLSLVIEHLRANTEWRDDHTHGQWSSWERINDGGFRVMFEDEDDTDLGDDVSEPFIVTVEALYNGVVHRISNRIVPKGNIAKTPLLLVSSEDPMTAIDEAKKAMIESWGYEVTGIDDGASQSEFDAACALVDVVYVSEEVNSGTLGTKLTDQTIGVVTDEMWVVDDLKIASSLSSYSSDTIDITDNTHAVTTGLALGEVQIMSTARDFVTKTGTTAAGGEALAERVGTSSAVLWAVEVGEDLNDSSVAAGRRVALPFGGNGFTLADLTADGQTLVKQAIDWAASGPTVTLVNPISRWTLDETAGTLAADSVGGHDGTYSSGGVTLAQSGQIDYAADFNGTTGYVEVPHHADYMVDEGAISAWFYLDDLSGTQQIFSKDSSGYDNGGHARLHTNGDDVEVRFQSNSTNYSLDSGNALTVSTWHHAVFTFGPAGMRLYVDGALVDSDTYTGGMATTSGGTGNTEPIALAADTGGSGDGVLTPLRSYFHGRLDDVRFYGDQLGPEQVAALFESGEASTTTEEQDATTPELVVQYDFVEPDPITPQLVSHWKLDETSLSGGRVAVGGQLRLRNTSVIDSYDSSTGTYAVTAGSDAVVSTNSTAADQVYLSENARIEGDAYGGPGGSVSTIFEVVHSAQVTGSSAILSSAVDLTLPVPPTLTTTASSRSDSGGSAALSGDLRYGSWNVYNNTTLTVSGDTTIVIDGNVTLETGTITIPSGSSLTLYVGGTLSINNQFPFNDDSQATDRLNVVVHGSGGDLNMTSGGKTAGTYYVADDVSIGNPSVFYGSLIVGDSLTNDNGSIHVDTAGGSPGGMTTAADEVGIADGIYEGGPEGGQAGLGDGGTAVDFNGTDQFVAVPHDADYLLNEGTFAFWFYPGDVSGTQTMLSKDSTNYVTGGHIRIYLSGSSVYCRLQDTSSSNYVNSASGSVSANTWHHVAVGFGPGGLRMYLDGVLVDSNSHTGGLGTSSGGVGNEEPMLFGADLWQSSSGTTSGWNLPYHGRLDDIRLYDRNLDTDQVGDLRAQTEPRAIAPAVVYDTSGNSPAHDLNIADPENITWITAGGLTVDTATTISSGGTVDRLHTAITESDAITIEAVFTPANLTQNGPARIVSYSNGTANRNFTVGQEAAGYELRLRTEFNSSGTPGAISSDVLAVGSKEHLLVTYDPVNEELRTYRNGTLEMTEAWSGDLDNWNDGYELVLANEASDDRPWLGTLHRVAIYDGTINTIQADNLFNGDPPGDGTGGEEGLAYQVEWLESP